MTFQKKTPKLFSLLLITAMMLATMPVQSVYAASIVVNDAGDAVGNDGVCTLREAITNANNDAATYIDCAAGAGADTITVPAGTYTLSSELLTTTDMNINGAGAATTIIQANANPNTATYRVLRNNGGSITLSGLTFRHGRCNGSCDGSPDDGGGIINQAGNLTLDASTVSSNYATYGGGIYNLADGETITIQNGSLIGGAGAGNQATTHGGGIYNRRGTMTIDASTVSANFATSHGGGIWTLQNLDIKNGSLIGGTGAANTATNGGGIYNEGGTLTIDASTISNNKATEDGAGIYNDNDDGTLTIDASTISNNKATEDGAGIYNEDGTVNIQNSSLINKNIAGDDGGGVFNRTGPLTVDASTISGNEANGTTEGNGGGIYNTDSDDVYIQNGSLITGNSATDYGGGVFSTAGGKISVDKSTISGNVADVSGGGIYLDNDRLSVTSSTISGNRAVSGGGIYSNNGSINPIENSTISGNIAVDSGGGLLNTNFGQVELINNSTFSGNSLTGAGNNNGANIANSAEITAISNTIIANPIGSSNCAGSGGFPVATNSLDNDSTCNFGAGGNGITAGMHYNTTLTDNGGPTKTHALLAGSTAINGAVSGATSSDQRGVSAVGTRDIGAFEYTGDDAALIVVSSDPADNSTHQTVTELTVTFSKDVVQGGVNGGDNVDNYILAEVGPNGVIDTISCLDYSLNGVRGDDLLLSFSGVSYDASTYTATINLGGAPLPDGKYRLFACGTTSIYDTIGLELNGGLSDTQIDFTIEPATTTTTPASLPATGFRHGEITQLPKQPAAKTYTDTAMTLEIPKLGVNMPIVGVPQSENGWDVTWLGNGAGYLAGSAFPTWAGNTVITGHVWDSFNQPGAFAEIKSLGYGDQVQIQAWGLTYTYEVRESKLVTVKNVDAAFQSEEYDWLTLVTCEFYNPFSGDYLFRRNVRAVLVDVR
ncbi:MAG: sortase [Chloroflexi bacterium]|nr:sortase [Chloroflexota bacterium]